MSNEACPKCGATVQHLPSPGSCACTHACPNCGWHFVGTMTPEQAMAEKRAYLHKVAVEEADEDYADSGSLSEDEEAERSGRPR